MPLDQPLRRRAGAPGGIVVPRGRRDDRAVDQQLTGAGERIRLSQPRFARESARSITSPIPTSRISGCENRSYAVRTRAGSDRMS